MLRFLILCASLATASCTVSVDGSRIFLPPDRTDFDLPEKSPAIWGEAELGRSPVTMSDPDGRETPVSIKIEHLTIGSGSIAASLASLPVADRPVIVDCTGTQADRFSYGAYTIVYLLPFGDLLLYDYPGYGDSDGTPSAEAFAEAADGVGEFVRQRFQGRSRIYWGYSIGGFSCARMAAADKEAGLLVLEAPTPNIEVAVESYVTPPLSWFVRPRIDEGLKEFDLADTVGQASYPVLILAGQKDRVLPARNARALFEALSATGNNVAYVEFEEANHYTIRRQPGFAYAVSEELRFLGLLRRDRGFEISVTLEQLPRR